MPKRDQRNEPQKHRTCDFVDVEVRAAVQPRVRNRKREDRSQLKTGGGRTGEGRAIALRTVTNLNTQATCTRGARETSINNFRPD